ncbi:MAG: LacI family transcriptional regulator [Victivallaceae bacterium]|nr:LacI family transcriptional regulator [Victivallaceae bacterium]
MKKESGNIKKIAAAAGVSTATVSRVFSRHPYVRPELRNKVLAIAREFGYAPNSFRPRETYALIMRGGEYLQFNAYNSPLIYGISSYLFEHELSIEIMPADNLKYLHRNSFKCLIDLSGNYSEVVEQIREIDLPVLLVNKEAEGLASICSDHKSGVIKAVNHLVGKGHHKIGFLELKISGWGLSERHDGYCQALAKHKIEVDEALIEKYSSDQLLDPVARLLYAGATAIIYSQEVNLVKFHNALEILGKKIPEDISIITFEDAETSPYLIPAYTTIDQQLKKIGQMVAERAIALANGDDQAELQLRLPNILIERNSVKPL